MGPKYEHFKFNIGDMVQQKVAARTYRHHRMMVIERQYRECPGGVQLYAVCRHEHSGQLLTFLEIELEPFVDTEDSPLGEVEASIRKVKDALKKSNNSDAQPQG